jgi:hypothetical protein
MDELKFVQEPGGDVDIVLDIDVNVFSDDSDDDDIDDVHIKEIHPKQKKQQLKPNPKVKEYPIFNDVDRQKKLRIYNESIFKGINTKSKKFSNSDLLLIFGRLENKWIDKSHRTSTLDEKLTKMRINFRADSNMDMEQLRTNYLAVRKESDFVYRRFIDNKIINTTDLQDPYLTKFKKISQLIERAYISVYGSIEIHRLMDPSVDARTAAVDDDLFKLSTKDVSKTDQRERLKMTLVEILYFHQCRRYHGCVYQQKYIDGYASHYWEKQWDMEEFVQEFTDEENNYDLWVIREKGNNYASVVEYLKDRTLKRKFPEVVRNDGVYAFKNGIYNSRHVMENGEPMWKFYYFTDDELIPDDLIACKYFDIEFKAHEYTPEGTTDNCETIPTPNFDKLTKFQFDLYKERSESIYEFLLVLLGRLLSPLRVWDKWEVFPFLIGSAGCGKSMIIQTVANLFENVDIGWLQDSNEGKFAFSPFAKKKIVMSTEIKRTFNTPATLFQQMISGENITMAKKGEEPVELRWTQPIIFAGNELFNLADKGGSITRRTITIPFYRKVKEENKIMDMDERLLANVGNILHKMTCYYLRKRKEIGKQSIWNNMPIHFIEQREKVSRETNPFVSFINTNTLVEYNQEFYCQMDLLRLSFKSYCRTNGHDFENLRPDVYMSPFADLSDLVGFEIHVKENVKMDSVDEEGVVTKDTVPHDYVMGLRLIDF